MKRWVHGSMAENDSLFCPSCLTIVPYFGEVCFLRSIHALLGLGLGLGLGIRIRVKVRIRRRDYS